MTDKNLDWDIEVREAEPPKPIPENMYIAVISDITSDEGNFGPYVKIEFKISDEGEYKDVIRTKVVSRKMTRSKNGKHSNLYKIAKSVTGEEPPKDQKFNIMQLLNKPCRIVVKNDKEVDGVLYQTVTDVLPA